MLNPESRTYKSLRNSSISLWFYVVTFILSFISRRILIRQLGEDLVGLNTTASSLLSLLNLAELGIGTAVGYTLYKPLREKDINVINEIVSLQGWLYRRIAFFIIFCSIVLSFFLPFIFEKSQLPPWTYFTTFFILLFASLLGYFVNYRQIVLSANQQQYKVQLSFGTVTILKILFQLIVVSVFEYKYAWWLFIELLFSIIASIAINVQIRKTFPQLKTDFKRGAELRTKYPIILKKIKQLFVHKIGTIALNNTSPLVIYAYSSLAMVTSYGNYLVINRGVSSLFNAVFNGMNASVGNLIAEGNQDRIDSVFRELFSSRFLIVSTCCYCMFMLYSQFISLWVGGQFILDYKAELLIVALFYISASREVVDSFLNGYGLFKDIWAPLAEAVLNIGCSVLLGAFYGLHGILLGVLISQLAIIIIWKPIFLFRAGFCKNPLKYFAMYIKHLLLFGLTALILTFALKKLSLGCSSSFLSFVVLGIFLEIISLLLLGFLLYCFEDGMRSFVKRVHVVLLSRK